jgi:hypothetical protein
MAYLNHVVGPCKIIGTPDVIIDQVSGQSYSAGWAKNIKGSGGQLYPTFSNIMSGVPRMSLSTEAIAQFLTAASVDGLVLVTPRGFEMYNQAIDDATGKRATGSNHEKIASVKTLIIPRRLTCSHGGIAKIDFDVFGISSDGVTHPFTLTASVALPTVAGVVQQFTLGPIKINGTAYEGIQDFSIDFGVREAIKSANGLVYPTRGHFETIAPRVTIRTDDAAVLAALTLSGTAQSSTDTVLYLRKCSDTGIRVADATAEHISFTIDECIWTATDKGGSHPGVLATSFDADLTYDGTNAPIVFNGATAIS